jgi:hypothetical protein
VVLLANVGPYVKARVHAHGLAHAECVRKELVEAVHELRHALRFERTCELHTANLATGVDTSVRARGCLDERLNSTS